MPNRWLVPVADDGWAGHPGATQPRHGISPEQLYGIFNPRESSTHTTAASTLNRPRVTARRSTPSRSVAFGTLAVALVALPLSSQTPAERSITTRASARSGELRGRESLVRIADRFIGALVRHDPSAVPIAPSARFTENGRESKPGAGLWRTAHTPGRYRAYVADVDSNGVAVQTVLHDGPDLVQVQIRLKVRDGRITEGETLIARNGDTCCWDPQRLDSLPPVFEQPISTDELATRERLVSIADSYFAALHTAGTADYHRERIIGEGMNRYENGKQTTNLGPAGNRVTRWDAATQLDSALFGQIRVVHRRYPVVDTRYGTVLAIVVFQYPARDRPPEIISELFKIAGDKIREIRAVMVRQSTTGWN